MPIPYYILYRGRMNGEGRGYGRIHEEANGKKDKTLISDKTMVVERKMRTFASQNNKKV